MIFTWIIAAVRNEQFFSLAELNASIREKLDAYNACKFQKKECSRLSLFLGKEMPLLAPLPVTSFELAEWKQATVQFNYHILPTPCPIYNVLPFHDKLCLMQCLPVTLFTHWGQTPLWST